MTLEQECDANETDAAKEYLDAALVDAEDRANDSTQPSTREHYLGRANAIRRAAHALRVKGMLVAALEAALVDHDLNCSGDESSAGCSLRDQLRDALAEARKP